MNPFHCPKGESVNRTDLLKMLLGVAIIVALGIIDWYIWRNQDLHLMRRSIHKVLFTGIAITLLWMYWKWENRG